MDLQEQNKDIIYCKYCNERLNAATVQCDICQFPLQGTEQEQSKFIVRMIKQKQDVETAVKRLRNGRLVLYFVAAFQSIVPLLTLEWDTDEGKIGIGTGIVFGAIFLGFALLSYKKPKISFLIPLILISLFYIILAVASPISIVSGLLWKVLILMGLAYAYSSADKSAKIFAQNPYLASLYNKEESNDENLLDQEFYTSAR